MSDNLIIPERATAIAELLGALPEVRAIFLFGSHAEGEANSLSDIDLGIVMADNNNSVSIVDLYHHLARRGWENGVDLVILTERNVLLRHEATKHNIVLYADSDFDTSEYIVKALRDVEFHQPIFALREESLKRRLSGKE